MNPLYRVEGRLYRAEPKPDGWCYGCAFFGAWTSCKSGKFDCMNPSAIAKLIPPNLPIPASVTVVEC